MIEDNERDEQEQTSEDEHGIRPVIAESPDVKSAIDEAVEAVEAIARRRQEDEHHVGRGQASEDVGILQEEVSHLRDRLLRTLADFDNYRKRAERERADDRKYATVEILREILGVVDNLERALAAQGGLEDLKAGVEMILRQMEDVLRRSGAEEVAAVDREFDPSVHEAVSRVEDPDIEVPRVIEEMQRGFTVYDRLLRPAIVRVAVPVPPAADGEEGEQPSAKADADESESGES